MPTEREKKLISKGLKEGVPEKEFSKMKRQMKFTVDFTTLSIRDKFGNLWTEVDKKHDKRIGGIFQIWRQNHRLEKVV